MLDALLRLDNSYVTNIFIRIYHVFPSQALTVLLTVCRNVRMWYLLEGEVEQPIKPERQTG